MEMANKLVVIGRYERADMTLMSKVEVIFKSLACINASFLKADATHMNCSATNPGIDMADAEHVFNNIAKMEKMSLKTCVSVVVLILILSIVIIKNYNIEEICILLHTRFYGHMNRFGMASQRIY